MDSKSTVLVTGADGFIGSHLTDLLLERGYNVRAISYYNSFNNWGWLEGNKHPNLEVVTGDVRDANFCRVCMEGIETVFHLAALIAIPYSYIAPQSYIDTNVVGTLNICQAAMDKGVKRLLCTSTSEVYGTAQYVPIDEKHPKQPQSPYSASKIGADMIAMSFFNSFDLPLTIVRPFNTYGPRQSSRAIIPTIISQVANGVTEIKLGDLRPTRDFNFVRDTSAGFLAIAGSDETIGKEINISTGEEISMGDLVKLIGELMGVKISVITDEARIRPEKSEVFRLLGDNTLISSLTDWKPDHSIREGLQATIDWISRKENLATYKHEIYNV